jgi:peroxiredoxin
MKDFIMDAKARFFFIAIVGFTAAILASMISCTESRKPEGEKSSTKMTAPDFSLKDLTGKNFTLSAHKGKPVLLIFITTWCPTCRSEMPRYNNIHKQYSRHGLEVVNIDIEEPREKVSRFAEKYNITYRMLLDEKGKVAEAYRIAGIPAMVLIDKEGNVLSRQYLAMDRLLENLFGKN